MVSLRSEDKKGDVLDGKCKQAVPLQWLRQ